MDCLEHRRDARAAGNEADLAEWRLGSGGCVREGSHGIGRLGDAFGQVGVEDVLPERTLDLDGVALSE